MKPTARVSCSATSATPFWIVSERSVQASFQVSREEPVGAPFAQTAQRRDAGLHLVVGKRGELVEVELGAREAEHVLGLPAREAERGQPLLVRARETLARRERDRMHSLFAEAFDQAAAHRERGV